MRISLRIVAVLALLALVVGIATATQEVSIWTPAKGRAIIPSSVIFPDQQIPLRFFHDKHIAEEIDCTTCHEEAETSIRASDVLVPVGAAGEEVCTVCHDFEEGAKADPPSACSTCHGEGYVPEFEEGVPKHESQKALNKPASIVIPTPNLRMNHKVHIDKGIACSECHGTLKDIQIATRENALPHMGTCLNCHDGSQAPSECRTCHLAGKTGKLLTTFGSGELKPAGHFRNDAHDDQYLQNHKMTAKGDEAYCGQCHEEKYCLQCHNGVSRPLSIHPNNWILTHPLSARRNNPTCTSCHRTQSFCLECHKRMKVVSKVEFSSSHQSQSFDESRFGRFHPPNWSDRGSKLRADNRHAVHAQRNIRTCAACHSERTCTSCHATSEGQFKGTNTNPHGAGFRNSRKCRALQSRNSRVCTKCHAPGQGCN
ncbi:MAG TPA: hypothetical protein EYN66_09080 [Myxococcales bacterium]|nr:hypothetical protein [Myxococcales bacterium]